jgi:hypothetical protein
LKTPSRISKIVNSQTFKTQQSLFPKLPKTPLERREKLREVELASWSQDFEIWGSGSIGFLKVGDQAVWGLVSLVIRLGSWKFDDEAVWG